jgi:hypothetical protein
VEEIEDSRSATGAAHPELEVGEAREVGSTSLEFDATLFPGLPPAVECCDCGNTAGDFLDGRRIYVASV